MAPRISRDDVVRLFRMHGGTHWEEPCSDDIDAFHRVLDMLMGTANDHFDSLAPVHPFERAYRAQSAARVLEHNLPQLKKAAGYLARELPRMTDLGKKAIMSARVHESGAGISESDIQALEALQKAAVASREAFSASVFHVVGKPSSDPRSHWYSTARIIAFFAKTAWTNAGNRSVSIGVAAKTPVAQLTQAAVEMLWPTISGRAGKTKPPSAGAIAKMLHDWQREP
jgi:hypothetical protein